MIVSATTPGVVARSTARIGSDPPVDVDPDAREPGRPAHGCAGGQDGSGVRERPRVAQRARRGSEQPVGGDALGLPGRRLGRGRDLGGEALEVGLGLGAGGIVERGQPQHQRDRRPQHGGHTTGAGEDPSPATPSLAHGRRL
jgi:hypothetical protein